jgi:hypothetical protein
MLNEALTNDHIRDFIREVGQTPYVLESSPVNPGRKKGHAEGLVPEKVEATEFDLESQKPSSNGRSRKRRIFETRLTEDRSRGCSNSDKARDSERRHP